MPFNHKKTAGLYNRIALLKNQIKFFDKDELIETVPSLHL